MSDESETYSGGESDTLPITEKCLLFEKQLQSVKSALTGSVLCFWGIINESKASCFHDHLELLNYLRDRLLPICNKSREYKFDISFDSDKSAAEHVIASILETPQLNHCSSLNSGFIMAQMNRNYNYDCPLRKFQFGSIGSAIVIVKERNRFIFIRMEWKLKT